MSESESLHHEFRYLLLFAALSGRTFTKADLNFSFRLNNPEIEKLASATGCLTVVRKGRANWYSANPKTLEWVADNLHRELPGKNQATQAIFEILRAKTASYLKSRRISLADFLAPEPVAALEEPTPDPPSAPYSGPTHMDAVRHAYLALSGGRFKERILLKDLRQRLGSMSREDQDATFKTLIQTGMADFYPEDDPMSRDEEDDKAALVLDDRRRHVVYLHPEARS